MSCLHVPENSTVHQEYVPIFLGKDYILEFFTVRFAYAFSVLSQVSFMKRDAIEYNHCSFQ